MSTASRDMHNVKPKMRLHMVKHILSLNNGHSSQNCGYYGRIDYCSISIEILKYRIRILFPNRIINFLLKKSKGD